jgi:protein Mpv17
MASVALARAYQHSFDSHPYATLAFTNGTLSAIGDCVAQSAQAFVSLRHIAYASWKLIEDGLRPARGRKRSTTRHSGMIPPVQSDSSPLVSPWVRILMFSCDPPRLTCFIGPVIGRWNQVLEKYFPLRATGQVGRQAGSSDKVSVRALTKRVAADQLFMAPIGVSVSSLFRSAITYRHAARPLHRLYGLHGRS